MLSLIGTIIVGAIIGLIARALKPGNASMGWIMTIVLGIAGSLIANYIGHALGWYREGRGAGLIGGSHEAFGSCNRRDDRVPHTDGACAGK